MKLPKHMREHFARTAGYVQREDMAHALDTLVIALRELNTLHTETQRRIFKQQFNAHLQNIVSRPHIIRIIGGQAAHCLYKEGREGGLSTLLREVAKILRQSAPEKALAQEQQSAELRERLQSLLDKGHQAIEKGELGIARGFLERTAAEFADNVTVLEYVGHVLDDNAMFQSAGIVYAKATDVAPKIMENYTKAIDAFMNAEDYARAEGIFQKALRQFGGHERTYARMSRMYFLWKNFLKAEEFAQLALERNPEEAEALAVHEALRTATLQLAEKA